MVAEQITRVIVDEQSVQSWTTPEGASVLVPIRDRLRLLREQLYNPAAQQPAGGAAAAGPEGGKVRRLHASLQKHSARPAPV